MNNTRRPLYAEYPDNNGRPHKRRSPNSAGQDPSLGSDGFTRQQVPSQRSNGPQTNEFGRPSLDLRLANGPTRGDPLVDAWSSLPRQTYSQSLTGNVIPPPYDDEHPLYPVGMPGSMPHWTGELPLQSPFALNPPFNGQPGSGYSYNGTHLVTNQTEWSAPGWVPQPDLGNTFLSQPRYGSNPTQIPSLHPTNNIAADLFTTEELEAAYGPFDPIQIRNSDGSVHGPATNQARDQSAAVTNDLSRSAAAKLALSTVALQRKQEVTLLPVSNVSRPPVFIPVWPVASGPKIDGRLRPRDNPPPRKPKYPKALPDRLSQTLMTNFARTRMTFLDSRPDPNDVSKIPIGTLPSSFLIMGIFDQKLSMSYVHPVSARSLEPVQQLTLCNAAEKAMEDWLSENGNKVIDLIQNCRRWTSFLPRSTLEQYNGFVTLSGRQVPYEYAYGDDEKASLCVSAAALSTYSNTKVRPVFDKEEYDRIRTGAKPILAKPASFLPSGVMYSSPEELSKLRRVPAGWDNGRLPPLQIAGQWVLDEPKLWVFVQVDQMQDVRYKVIHPIASRY